jgi:hypothetical protein
MYIMRILSISEDLQNTRDLHQLFVSYQLSVQDFFTLMLLQILQKIHLIVSHNPRFKPIMAQIFQDFGFQLPALEQVMQQPGMQHGLHQLIKKYNHYGRPSGGKNTRKTRKRH